MTESKHARSSRRWLPWAAAGAAPVVSGTGSGEVIRSDGCILTNNHVISIAAEPVVAIGAPLGLSGTVTSGIVSALDRTVEVPGENDRSALLVSALQTNGSINPGNSGGALVNCASQLVGVPTAGATVPNSGGGSIGLGFAIPVDLAKSIAEEIIATGRVTHAFFGLQTVPIPSRSAT
jgi:putative serine protease PepD